MAGDVTVQAEIDQGARDLPRAREEDGADDPGCHLPGRKDGQGRHRVVQQHTQRPASAGSGGDRRGPGDFEDVGLDLHRVSYLFGSQPLSDSSALLRNE